MPILSDGILIEHNLPPASKPDPQNQTLLGGTNRRTVGILANFLEKSSGLGSQFHGI